MLEFMVDLVQRYVGDAPDPVVWVLVAVPPIIGLTVIFILIHHLVVLPLEHWRSRRLLSRHARQVAGLPEKGSKKAVRRQASDA